MVRKAVLAILAFGMFSVVANGVLVSDAYAARWYPFYGYNRPSYLGQPCVASVQPSAPQVSTAYYPPSEDTAVTPQTTSPRQYNGARWYPFYGNRRPSYLDR
jgi:hypothetical protein